MPEQIKERYGVEGFLYLAVIVIAATLTVGFATISFIEASRAHQSADNVHSFVLHLCDANNAGRSDNNLHVRAPLRELLLTAAAARDASAHLESGKRAQVDALTAERYRVLASEVHNLPLLNCNR